MDQQQFEYTVCSDGVRREIHPLTCTCEYCQKTRALIQNWRDGEIEQQKSWQSFERK